MLLTGGPPLFAASARADVETPWLAREGHLIVIRRVIDPLRGFDGVTLETRRAQPDGTFRLIDSSSPLAETERRWFSDRGQLELFQHDLAARLEGLRLARVAEGWTSLEPLRVIVPASCEVGECAPSALLAGEIFFGETRLRADVEATEAWSRLLLAVPDTQLSLEVARVAPRIVELSAGRRVRLDLARVGSAHLTADRAFLLLSVDTVVPIHAEVPPDRVVIPVSLDMVKDVLALIDRDDS